MRFTLTRLAVGGLLLGLLAPSAFAADATAVADALVAAASATGRATATYQSASASGDDVTVTGYRMTSTHGREIVIVPTLVLHGVAARDKGGYTAASISFDGGSAERGARKVTWQSGSLSDAIVPTADEIKARAHLSPFRKVEVSGISVTSPDLAAPLDVSDVSLALDVGDDGAPRDIDLKVNGIHIPAAAFDAHPQQKAVVDALGYSDFLIDISVASGFDAATDTVDLRDLTVNIDKVGKLAILAKVSGVSLGKLASETNPSQAESSAKLDSLSVRFDNAGVVERALDMQAQMIGGTRDDVVAQLSGALPFMLNVIGNPAFQDKLAKAAATFLADPKSIAFATHAPAPVSFNDLADAAAKDPGSVLDLLKLDVTANQ